MGVSEFSGYFVMTFFLIVLAFSVYLIGKNEESEVSGLVAVSLICSAPIVLGFSRMFMLDLPLGAMTALSVLFYLKTNQFNEKKYSIWFGVFFGLGLLTKWTFIFVFFIPIIVDTVAILRNRINRKSRLINLLLFMSIALIITLPWYAIHLVQIVTGRLGELGRSDLSIFEHVVYYFTVLPIQFGIINTIIIIAGCILYLIQKSEKKTKIWLLFLSGYIFLSLIKTKSERLSFPLIPLFAVIGSIGIVNTIHLFFPLVKKPITISILPLSIAQFLFFTMIPPTSEYGKSISTFMTNAGGPRNEDWHQSDIVKTIADDIKKSSLQGAVVRVIPDQPYFNRYTLDYNRRLQNASFSLSGLSGLPNFYDYIIVREGTGVIHENESRKFWSNKISENQNDSSNIYTKIHSWMLPDSSIAALYKTREKYHPFNSDSLKNRLERSIGQLLIKFMHPTQAVKYSIQLTSLDSVEKGFIYSIRISTTGAEIGDFSFGKIGIPVRNIDVELKGLRIVPSLLMEKDSLIVVRLDQLIIHSISLNAEDIRGFVDHTQNGKLILHKIQLTDGEMVVDAELPKSQLRIDTKVSLYSTDSTSLFVSVKSLKINNISILPSFLNMLLYSYNPIVRTPEYLNQLVIGTVKLQNNSLTIGTE
jgi:hypothetical protein